MLRVLLMFLLIMRDIKFALLQGSRFSQMFNRYWKQMWHLRNLCLVASHWLLCLHHSCFQFIDVYFVTTSSNLSASTIFSYIVWWVWQLIWCQIPKDAAEPSCERPADGGYFGEEGLPIWETVYSPVFMLTVVAISYLVPICTAGIVLFAVSSMIALLGPIDYTKSHVN